MQQANELDEAIKQKLAKTAMGFNKISIRFFDDRKVRAVWDEENMKGIDYSYYYKEN
jgi:hypothetical protein